MSLCMGDSHKDSEQTTKPRSLSKDRRAPLLTQAPLEDSFESILEDQELFQAFEQFLITQFCQENLLFYSDVAKFRQLTEPKEIKSAAEAICAKYLGHSGNELVLNVDSYTLNQILAALSNPTTSMFDAAYQDVEQLLKTSYVTFVGGPSTTKPKPTQSSSIFSVCMSDVGVTN